MNSHFEQLTRDGYTIINDAIDLELINELRDDVERLQDELQRTPANNKFEGNHTTRTYNLLAYSELWQQVPVHPSVLPIVESVLGAECLISSLASIAIGPESAHKCFMRMTKCSRSQNRTSQPSVTRCGLSPISPKTTEPHVSCREVIYGRTPTTRR